MFKKISLSLIKFYQDYIKQALPASCRFTPNCSEYAKEAILKYGFLKGGFRAVKRLLSCRPFSGKAGYDPLI